MNCEEINRHKGLGKSPRLLGSQFLKIRETLVRLRARCWSLWSFFLCCNVLNRLGGGCVLEKKISVSCRRGKNLLSSVFRVFLETGCVSEQMCEWMNEENPKITSVLTTLRVLALNWPLAEQANEERNAGWLAHLIRKWWKALGLCTPAPAPCCSLHTTASHALMDTSYVLGM